MCEFKIYIKDEGETKIVVENIVSLIPKENGFILIDISGKRYEVDNSSIEYIDFLNHKVVLKRKS